MPTTRDQTRSFARILAKRYTRREQSIEFALIICCLGGLVPGVETQRRELLVCSIELRRNVKKFGGLAASAAKQRLEEPVGQQSSDEPASNQLAAFEKSKIGDIGSTPLNHHSSRPAPRKTQCAARESRSALGFCSRINFSGVKSSRLANLF